MFKEFLNKSIDIDKDQNEGRRVQAMLDMGIPESDLYILTIRAYMEKPWNGAKRCLD